MNKVENSIKEELLKILSAMNINDQIIDLDVPNDSSHGDYSTNIAMKLAKQLGKNPMEIAEEITKKLETEKFKENAKVEKIEAIRPGFINFKVGLEYYVDLFTDILSEDFGKGEDLQGKRIMMEYAHPNPFKSFHIGHLRNIVLGESLIRLIENQSAEVIRVNYQGDVGMHIAKCIWSFRKVDPATYPETADAKVALLGKCYSEGATAFEENEEYKQEIKVINKKIYTKEDAAITALWDLGKKWSLEKFHEIYERVGSHFVREYMETEVMELGIQKVKEALEKGILKESDGAIIFDGKPHDLDTRVFLNSEGLPTYEGKELGLAQMEFTDYGNIDLCIHNVAVEQISFFKVTFKVEELLDEKLFKGKQYHNVYEFVGLKKGKMSSRKGNVILGNDILNEAHERIKTKIKDDLEVDRDDIAEKLGVGSIKYSFLKISPKTYLAFDIDESVSTEGDSAPYIMYAYTRAQAILNQQKGDKEVIAKFTENSEINLLKHLSKFPGVNQTAAAEYSPNILSSYLYELAQAFNKFYTECPVLSAESDEAKNSRLKLTQATAQVLKNGLNLLGIETVEKM